MPMTQGKIVALGFDESTVLLSNKKQGFFRVPHVWQANPQPLPWSTTINTEEVLAFHNPSNTLVGQEWCCTTRQQTT